MTRRIIVLSGPIASGKSELANSLVEGYGFLRLQTADLITSMFDKPPDRAELQRAGEKLDRKHKGLWVAQALSRRLLEEPLERTVVVDSIRIAKQIDGIRESFGSRVVHVHLTAPDNVLAKRYLSRKSKLKEFSRWEDVNRNRTERNVKKLQPLADIVIDTDRCTAADVVARVAAHLGLFGRSIDRLVDAIVGGQYGSEGKGHIASYVASEYDLLVRVGGPNAGHTVYGEPPYTYHHLPSETRSSEARILLGPGATIWIPTLLKEIAECRVSAKRLSIDPQAMLIEESDRNAEVCLLFIHPRAPNLIDLRSAGTMPA